MANLPNGDIYDGEYNCGSRHGKVRGMTALHQSGRHGVMRLQGCRKCSESGAGGGGISHGSQERENIEELPLWG